MRLLVRLAVTTALVVSFCGGIARADEGIVVRTSVEPQEAWIGQRVLLMVDVLAADGWAQIRDPIELDIPGTYVLRTESQGTRMNETIRGTAYTGQRYELSLYCQRPGRVEIPAVPVTVTVKRWGASASETRHRVNTPETFFACKVPPGAEGVRDLISTTRLTANQTWSAKPDTLAPGDAVKRTIELTAENVSGMAFTPMRHPEINGVGIYPGEPSVTDETNRGALSGKRVETVAYVFEAPGEVVLPDVAFQWWDVDADRLRRIELPGLTIQVVGSIAPETGNEPVVSSLRDSRIGRTVLVLIVVLVGLGVKFGIFRRIVEWARRWMLERRESEGAFFRRVGKALRTGDSAAVYTATLRWLDRLQGGTRPARLDVFLERYGDAGSRAAAATLADRLATGERFVNSREMGRGLKKARGRYLRSQRREREVAAILPRMAP